MYNRSHKERTYFSCWLRAIRLTVASANTDANIYWHRCCVSCPFLISRFHIPLFFRPDFDIFCFQCQKSVFFGCDPFIDNFRFRSRSLAGMWRDIPRRFRREKHRFVTLNMPSVRWRKTNTPASRNWKSTCMKSLCCERSHRIELSHCAIRVLLVQMLSRR